MRNISRHAPVALALALGIFTSSCLVKRERTVKRNGVAASQGKPPIVATQEELNSRIAAAYNAIGSFQATMELSASVGSVYKDKITDYQDVHAFVLFRKPDDIRFIGKLPVVGQRLSIWFRTAPISVYRFQRRTDSLLGKIPRPHRPPIHLRTSAPMHCLVRC